MLAFSGIKVWLREPSSGRLLHSFEGRMGEVTSVAWSPDGKLLASFCEGAVQLWEPSSGRLLHTLKGYLPPDDERLLDLSSDRSVAWSPDGSLLASGYGDGVVRLWEPTSGRLLHMLEGHKDIVRSVAWSPDGKLLASGSYISSPPFNTEVRLWHTDTWEPLAVLTGLKGDPYATWHPRLTLMVTPGQRVEDLFIWHLDLKRLFQAAPSSETVHYSNAKVVLVGDSGVGKSGLALVLTGQPFAPTDSTHGRHVWLLDQQEVQQGEGPRFCIPT